MAELPTLAVGLIYHFRMYCALAVNIVGNVFNTTLS